MPTGCPPKPVISSLLANLYVRIFVSALLYETEARRQKVRHFLPCRDFLFLARLTDQNK
jgi:hypothetical protein